MMGGWVTAHRQSPRAERCRYNYRVNVDSLFKSLLDDFTGVGELFQLPVLVVQTHRTLK